MAWISWFGKEESLRPKCWLTNDPMSVYFLIHISLCPPRTDKGVRNFSGLFYLRTQTQFMGILIPQGPPNSTSKCHHVRDGVSKYTLSFGQGHIHSMQGACVVLIDLISAKWFHLSVGQKYLGKMLENACE